MRLQGMYVGSEDGKAASPHLRKQAATHLAGLLQIASIQRPEDCTMLEIATMQQVHLLSPLQIVPQGLRVCNQIMQTLCHPSLCTCCVLSVAQ